jgi:heme/copper-type cytochrome/quinol oxidase subunit 2
MRGFVTVHTQEDFTKWFDEEESKLTNEGNSVWN